MVDDLEGRIEMIREGRKKLGLKQVVYLSDIHVPFHDKKAVKSIEGFLHEQQPDVLVYGGDIVDFYAVSKFDKNPERVLDLQQEVIEGVSLMSALKKAAGNPKTMFLEGNHEFRMMKYLMRHPELASLDALRVPNLLRLDRLDIGYVPYDKGWVFNDFLFKHGTKASLYAARHEADLENISGMSGHIHRIQRHGKTDRQGIHTWHTVGHLSDPEQIDYVTQQVPNWQQGFGVVEMNSRNKTFEVYQPVINKGKFQFQGKVYKPK